LISRYRRARVVSYALGAYKVLRESIVIETSKKGSFDWKFKGLVPFLIIKRNWRATNLPLMPTFSPNTSNQNFEITILCNVVESSEN